MERQTALLCRSPTLIQAVTSSIPIFAMQTTKLPVSVCDELDRLNRIFFWGGSEKRTKVHLCQWRLVYRPKCKGGLSFKKSSAMNQALLAKIGWRIQNMDWCFGLGEAKYLKGMSILDHSLPTKQV